MQLPTNLWDRIQLQPKNFLMFNLGIANGAKVGLKLRLASALIKKL